jgi:hypothetical protein
LRLRKIAWVRGMAGNIFINYRHGVDPGFTQALFSRLEQGFLPERLFMDVDNIAPGLDFVQVLNEQVARCDVLIAARIGSEPPTSRVSGVSTIPMISSASRSNRRSRKRSA